MEGITASGVINSLVLNVINVVLLYIFVRALVYKPVHKFMQERTARVNEQMELAERMQEEAAQIKKKSDDILANADSIADEVKRVGLVDADKQVQRILTSAHHQADEIVSGAREKMEQERAAYQEVMKDEISELCVDMAAKILEREVKKGDNQDIIDKYFSKVG